MAKNLDLYLDQGADFVAVLPAVTAANVVVDLTTYTVAAQIRRSYAIERAINLTATVSNAANGIITLSLPKATTEVLTPTRYVYDVLITNASNVSTRVFEGLLFVNASATAKTTTVVSLPTVPDDYGGSLT